ncbi:hypothetical protein CtesDRAFT_PD2101 [Comamonas testosteroni KF-1]|uniref:Uncharacterized protein n=1 Tax=Comamonas testosteroni (strain DSM 14576 / KF-1) TaxID=399795 RepID=B7WRH0_COMTK|nr:hypothetical protein CtesDRAFT_PD2101 [Comamonas testosteroni KF-1]
MDQGGNASSFKATKQSFTPLFMKYELSLALPRDHHAVTKLKEKS